MDRPGIGGRKERDEVLRARLTLRDLFTPTQPVTDRSSFAGRLPVLARLIELIEEQRSHVVLYGERGIGKTSLLHVLAEVARDSDYVVGYATCGAHSRFEDIFRAMLREVPLLFHGEVAPTAAESEAGGTIADRLPKGAFDARELAELCANIVGTRVLIILDEYDRIEDPEFRQTVAELIKNLSDRAARVQIVLAGVAFNLQELIGYVPSIRRNVIGLPMPRLAGDEVRALIEIGEKASGASFDPQVARLVGALANGSPYLARLLCHHSSMKALDAGRLTIETGDFLAALDKVVDESESRLTRTTARQVRALGVHEDRDLLGAAARASTTPDGWFTREDVAHQSGGHGVEQGIERIVAAEIIEREQEGDEVRYRFRDEALPTFMWMALARDNLRGGNPEAFLKAVAA
ncbi:MAG: ATP-binding protein [Sphingomonadaceae bacterium]|nr:ATP-binding protein [Sphingomonadaceae bacterium]